MKDIDVLINDPERDKKMLSYFFKKSRKPPKNWLNQRQKSEKWYKAGNLFTQTISTYTQMIDIQPLIMNPQKKLKNLVLWYAIDIPYANLDKFA